MTALERLLDSVSVEVIRARQRYPAFHSGHEGYAVIREELDELWDEVKASNGLRQSEAAGAEAVQVAAMAIRFALDLCDLEGVSAFTAGKAKAER